MRPVNIDEHPADRERIQMPAHKPEECDALLTKALEAGDLDAGMELYEPGATFVAAGSELVSGIQAIRKVLQAFIEVGTTFSLDDVSAVPSADGTIAVTRARGTSTSPGPDGNPVTTPFHSVEVVRKQADGTWRFLIDDPNGEGLA
jgi:uncharacterized protein (TIGR02246 family)